MIAVDLDGDGDLDLLSASRTQDRVVWYENLLIEADEEETTEVTPSPLPVTAPTPSPSAESSTTPPVGSSPAPTPVTRSPPTDPGGKTLPRQAEE